MAAGQQRPAVWQRRLALFEGLLEPERLVCPPLPAGDIPFG
jgi:hypothetical protein